MVLSPPHQCHERWVSRASVPPNHSHNSHTVHLLRAHRPACGLIRSQTGQLGGSAVVAPRSKLLAAKHRTTIALPPTGQRTRSPSRRARRRPDRPVVALMGDGSMHYAITAVWAAARHQIPVTVVVTELVAAGIADRDRPTLINARTGRRLTRIASARMGPIGWRQPTGTFCTSSKYERPRFTGQTSTRVRSAQAAFVDGVRSTASSCATKNSDNAERRDDADYAEPSASNATCRWIRRSVSNENGSTI